MSVRSNGVMNVRRTAVRTSRVISSASFSRAKICFAIKFAPIAALQQTPQGLGTGYDDRGMPDEQLEETLLLGHQCLEPAEHCSPLIQDSKR